jgi:hypothetical protein
VAIGSLLRLLTGDTTRIEVRATLQAAEQQQIIIIESLAGKHKITSPVAIIRLQPTHSLVQKTLTLRNQLIAITYDLLSKRAISVSEAVLTEEFRAKAQLSKSEAFFWIELLIQIGSFIIEPAPADTSNVARLLTLSEQDSSIDQILARDSQ